MKVETWLPGFRGYYNSLWDLSDDDTFRSEAEYINRERQGKGFATLPEKWLAEKLVDEADYETYYQDLSRSIAKFTEGELNKHLGTKMVFKFQELKSPKFYNYSNDSINIEVELSEQDLERLVDYLKENDGMFSQYLSGHYTSRDGFISHYPNSVSGWVEETNLFTELSGHYLGAILDFVIENEESEWNEALYYGSEAYLNFNSQKYIDSMVDDYGTIEERNGELRYIEKAEFSEIIGQVVEFVLDYCDKRKILLPNEADPKWELRQIFGERVSHIQTFDVEFLLM